MDIAEFSELLKAHVSNQSRASAIQDTFSKLDTNHDGQLDSFELASFVLSDKGKPTQPTVLLASDV